MTAMQLRVPPGPTDAFNSADDLFVWMNENFARHGEIYKASVFGAEIYVVSNPEFCERILRWNWRNYARSGQVVKRIALLLGNGLIASNGAFWQHQRRMMQPAFSKTSVGGLLEIIKSINAELLEKWKRAAVRGESVNVTHDVSLMVLKITLTAIFTDDYARVAPYFNVLADESARNLEFAQTFRPLAKVIRDIAEQRRQNGAIADDLLGRMMQARDRQSGQAMTDAQLAKEVMTLIVAGHETTAGLLNWLWYLLARHPEMQSRLSAEFDRLPWQDIPDIDTLKNYAFTRSVIEEALRLYPPLWLMTRRAINDDLLGEYLVPAGTEIYISPYLIQRNPHLWPAPDEFDPDRMTEAGAAERHDLALCPFGAGPRNCIGELFARVEIQIHVMMFARELRLVHHDTEPAEISTGMNLLSKSDFIMSPKLLQSQNPDIALSTSTPNR
jgi:cytochrome P450